MQKRGYAWEWNPVNDYRGLSAQRLAGPQFPRAILFPLAQNLSGPTAG